MLFDSERKTITTERYILRPFHQTDAEAVARLCQSDGIYQNTLFIPRPYTVDSAYAWIARHAENFDEDRLYEFAITTRNSGELIGAISISNVQRFMHGELGYWIGEQYWNQGCATEAGRAMLEFAFLVKGYHKVYARHFASNPASGKVMLKLGMVQEGRLKEHVKKDDRFEDLICYGLMKRDWQQRSCK